jgi:hypothetical protein
MPKPSAETEGTLRDIQAEIAEGMILRPKDEAERGYNIGTCRALKIISNYLNGIGLFQIEADPLMNRSHLDRGPHA